MSQAVEVLARWLLEWSERRLGPDGCLHDLDETGVARTLAEAMCDPARHGPLANPEFVMKLPGHSPSCVHVTAKSVTFTRLDADGNRL